MKKILTIILAIGLMATFTACNNKQGTSGDQNKSGEEQQKPQSEGTILSLEGNPTTGYAWYPSNYDSNIIKVEALENEPKNNNEKQNANNTNNGNSGNSGKSGENANSGESGEGEQLVGAPSIFKFKIIGLKEGSTTLTFDYYRSWEGAETSIDTLEYVVTVDDLLNVVATEKVPEGPNVDEFTPTAEMQGLVDDLVAKSGVQFRAAASSKILVANAPTFVGLSEEQFTRDVVDSIVYEPMISPATSSMCIVKLSDTADMARLKQDVLDNCNPMKWICTGAKKCLVIESGRYILLVMSTPEDCEALKTAFTDHFGADNVGKPLTKDGLVDEFDEGANGGIIAQ